MPLTAETILVYGDEGCAAVKRAIEERFRLWKDQSEVLVCAHRSAATYLESVDIWSNVDAGSTATI